VGDKAKKGQSLVWIGNQTIRAPQEGTVISINTTVGSHVGNLQSLVALAEIDPIRVVFDVYPKDMDKVSLGQKVEVVLIGHADHLFPGTIQYISHSLDEISQTLKVGADVENIDHHLKFGMFVQGKFLREIEGAILTVPEEAVVRFNQEFAVFVPGEEEGSFLKRRVHLGQHGKGRFEILEGLKQGEKVVTQGSFTLKSELMKGTLGEDAH
jgi:RND family efflux transporter MFP subunit